MPTTANALQKAVDATTLTDSLITDDDVTVTVTAPDESEANGSNVLEVKGEGGRTLLSLDAYGNLRLTGAEIDPTNGGASLILMNAAVAQRHRLVADNGSGVASFALGFGTDAKLEGNSSTGVITIAAVGGLIVTNLPTSDPEVTGQLWVDSGTLKISAG